MSAERPRHHAPALITSAHPEVTDVIDKRVSATWRSMKKKKKNKIDGGAPSTSARPVASVNKDARETVSGGGTSTLVPCQRRLLRTA